MRVSNELNSKISKVRLHVNPTLIDQMTSNLISMVAIVSGLICGPKWGVGIESFEVIEFFNMKTNPLNLFF